jgi:hypothetical protein
MKIITCSPIYGVTLFDRIWRTQGLRYSESDTHRAFDTELMAHLINSRGDNTDYALNS